LAHPLSTVAVGDLQAAECDSRLERLTPTSGPLDRWEKPLTSHTILTREDLYVRERRDPVRRVGILDDDELAHTLQ
jgi:hypothetical protein